jgi:hypothetical protein
MSDEKSYRRDGYHVSHQQFTVEALAQPTYALQKRLEGEYTKRFPDLMDRY